MEKIAIDSEGSNVLLFTIRKKKIINSCVKDAKQRITFPKLILFLFYITPSYRHITDYRMRITER